MKKLILCTALIAISLQAKLCAQTREETPYVKQMKKSKTEQTYNINRNMVNLRDFVVLNEGRMILELSDLNDYESFRNLDSILQVFRKDIAFYKDSLNTNPTGSVRIDYVINPEYSFKKIRFKKYSPDGNNFMNQGGEISKLKFDQDTINIIMQKLKPGFSRRKQAPCSISYSIGATFVLGNYYDIDKVINDNVLKGIVDTLEKASQLKRTKRNVYGNPLTIIYNPYYQGKGRMLKTEGLAESEFDYVPFNPHKSRFLSLHGTIDVGLVRNTVAPSVDFGIQYNKYFNRGTVDRNIFRLSVSPYFFFSKDGEGNNLMNDNWFVNADIGSIYDRNAVGWFGKECTIGFGYLALSKGGYFKNTTFKVFTDLQVTPWITIVPEVIFTDNCKQIFPGFTLKVF